MRILLAIFALSALGWAQCSSAVDPRNKIRYAVDCTGTTGGAKILAAINDGPAGGVTVDARGILTGRTFASNIFSGITKPVELYLAQGEWTATLSMNIPANVTIEFGQGAILSPAVGQTLTINGAIIAPAVKIFGGAGVVTVAAGNPFAYAEWWGGATSNTGAANLPFLQAALNGSAGTVLRLGSTGTMDVSGTLTIPSNTSIKGGGAVLRLRQVTASAVPLFSGSSCTNVFIDGLYLYGTGVWTNAGNNGYNAIALTGCSNIGITNNIIRNFGGMSLSLDAISHALIEGNTIEGTWVLGVVSCGTKKFCQGANYSGQYGISVGATTGNNSDIRILGNEIYNNQFGIIGGGDWFGAPIATATNANPVVFTTGSPGQSPPNGTSVTISGATGAWTPINGVHVATYIDSTHFSIPINSAAFGAFPCTPTFTPPCSPVTAWVVAQFGLGTITDNFIISNNNIHDIQGQHGLYVSANNLTITGNSIADLYLAGIKVVNESDIPGVPGSWSIVGNTITAAAGNGMVLGLSAGTVDMNNILVSSNVISDSGTAIAVSGLTPTPTGTVFNVLIDGNIMRNIVGEAIYCTGYASRARVSGNIIDTTSFHGLLLSSSCNEWTVEDNYIFNAGGGAQYGILVDGATNTSLIGNRVVDRRAGAARADYEIVVTAAAAPTAIVSRNYVRGAAVTNLNFAAPLQAAIDNDYLYSINDPGVTPTIPTRQIEGPVGIPRRAQANGGAFDANLPVDYGSPYLMIGGSEVLGPAPGAVGQYEMIGFGYHNGVMGTETYQAAEFGLVVTDNAGYHKGDFCWGLRDATTNTKPIRRMCLNSNGYLQLFTGGLNVGSNVADPGANNGKIQGTLGVGVGTVGAQVDVSGGTLNLTHFQVDTTASTSGYTGKIALNDTGMFISTNSSVRDIELQTNSTTRLTVLGAGGVKVAGLSSSALVGTDGSGVFNSITLPLSIANGGTGSATQPFVDLTTAQASIGGAKTFTTTLTVSAGTAKALNLVKSNDSYFLMMNNTAFGSTDATGFGMYQSDAGVATLVNNNVLFLSASTAGHLTAPGNIAVTGNVDVTGVYKAAGTSGITQGTCNAPIVVNKGLVTGCGP